MKTPVSTPLPPDRFYHAETPSRGRSARPLQGEDAVVLFGLEIAEEAGGRGPAVVDVDAARQPAEIRAAFQQPAVPVGPDRHGHRILEAEGAAPVAVRRVVARVEAAVGPAGHQAAQASVVPVRVAAPGPFPLAFDADREPFRAVPVLVEAGTARRRQKRDQPRRLDPPHRSALLIPSCYTRQAPPSCNGTRPNARRNPWPRGPNRRRLPFMRMLSALLPLALAACGSLPQLHVKPTDDFEVSGAGDAPAWATASWTAMRPRQADGLPYDARFKLLYSKTGLYLLLDGTDRTLTTTGR